MSLDVVSILWRLLGWDAQARLPDALACAPREVREEMLQLAANAALEQIHDFGIWHTPTREDLLALMSSSDSHVRELAVRLAGWHQPR